MLIKKALNSEHRVLNLILFQSLLIIFLKNPSIDAFKFVSYIWIFIIVGVSVFEYIISDNKLSTYSKDISIIT